MNKKYIEPVMQVTRFDSENIVTLSSGAFTKGLYNTSAGTSNWNSDWTSNNPSSNSLEFEQ